MKRWDVFLITIVAMSLFLILPGRNYADSSSTSLPVRHYFEQCNSNNISSIQEKMSRDKVIELCGGVEFPAFETVRNGFVFSIDEKRSGSITIPGWMPGNNQKIDFLCSKELVVLVYYDDHNQATHLTKLPKARAENHKHLPTP